MSGTPNAIIEPPRSRPGRQSLMVLALLGTVFLAASNWSQLKALVGLE